MIKVSNIMAFQFSFFSHMKIKSTKKKITDKQNLRQKKQTQVSDNCFLKLIKSV